jgi:hypothetical protein
MVFNVDVNYYLLRAEERFSKLRKNGDLTDAKRNKLTGAIEALKAVKRGVDAEYLFEVLKVGE